MTFGEAMMERCSSQICCSLIHRAIKNRGGRQNAKLKNAETANHVVEWGLPQRSVLLRQLYE